MSSERAAQVAERAALMSAGGTGVAAFTLALIYRLFTIDSDDIVDDDAEDARVSHELPESVLEEDADQDDAAVPVDEDAPAELDALPKGKAR